MIGYLKEKGLMAYVKEIKNDDFTYLVIENVSGFSVSKTFECGQCFRFERVEGSAHEVEFAGVAFGRFVSVAQDKNDIFIYNCDAEFFSERLCAYLGLDMDYESIRNDIARRCPGEYMKNVMLRGEGIRILRQDRWEALCSFIISQNNNIPRIKRIIKALSERCGERIDAKNMREHGASEAEYSFPNPEAVLALGEEGLRALKVGFRASYIIDAAEKVCLGELDLDRVSLLKTADCINALLCIKGVGVKVASCTALFGMEKYDAFPIDVWIRRVLEKNFAADFDPMSLGDYAGIAQQYMFFAARFD